MIYFIPFAIIYGTPIRIVWVGILWIIKRFGCGRRCLARIMQYLGSKSITLLWVSTTMGYLLFIYLMIILCVPVMEQIYDDGHSVYFSAIATAWNERGFAAYFDEAEIVEHEDIQHLKLLVALFNGAL